MEYLGTKYDRPIFALAPMEDVTDTVFREIVMRASSKGRLHAVFAEFTSTDGLCHEEGRPNVIHRLMVNESERELLREMSIKLVAQIWGSDPEKFRQVAEMISNEMDFDAIDINMGCPVKKIVKQASCSELIRYPELAREIVLATKEGSSIPVTVKTRTGIDKHITEDWIANLISAKPDAIILHGRTQKMMSKKPADWSEIAKAVQVRNEMLPEMPLLGNGDVFDYESGLHRAEESGADGVMIGRGIFGNPWFFNRDSKKRTAREKIELLLEHSGLFWETWKHMKNYAIMRKFFKIYASDFFGASDLRHKLMQAENHDQVNEICNDFLNNFDFEKEAENLTA